MSPALRTRSSCIGPTATAAGDNQGLGGREHECRSATATTNRARGRGGPPCLAGDDKQCLSCLEADSAIDNAAQPGSLYTATQRAIHSPTQLIESVWSGVPVTGEYALPPCAFRRGLVSGLGVCEHGMIVSRVVGRLTWSADGASSGRPLHLKRVGTWQRCQTFLNATSTRTLQY